MNQNRTLSCLQVVLVRAMGRHLALEDPGGRCLKRIVSGELSPSLPHEEEPGESEKQRRVSLLGRSLCWDSSRKEAAVRFGLMAWKSGGRLG